MDKQKRHTRWISRQAARLKLAIRAAGVHMLLAAWVVPERIARTAARMRADFPVARTALLLAVCAAIVVPTVFYKNEREHRIELSGAYQRLNVETGMEISTLGTTLQTLLTEQDHLRSLLLDAGYTVVSGDRMWMRLMATGYSSSVRETDDTPFITASNTRTRPGVVALSRDILGRYNGQAPFRFGDAIHISGIGDFSVEDSMHWRWRKRLDIWFPSPEAARNFGIRRVTVTLPLAPINGLDEAASNEFAGVGRTSSYAATAALPQ
jgi:3D (Asp-Asp-Asp) domain-containing protein